VNGEWLFEDVDKEILRRQLWQVASYCGVQVKERCTPLAKSTAAVLGAWIKRQGKDHPGFLFPNSRGERLSADAVQYLVAKYARVAQGTCPSLIKKNVSPHVLRHTAAMEMLQAGVDRSMISIWLGHESIETTQIYLDANLALKEEILAKTNAIKSKKLRYRPGDRLLNFGTRLKANPVDLATLVEELVDNALSFSRQHTPVHVRAWCEASGLHITVADTGRGMTPAQLEHLGVFWQCPQDLYQPQNLGLGLMLVHRLVHHLGGQFRIESRAGVGTTAHVTLPMLEA
jgi:signal transduction histidine kinase